jgi:post-segregation antitoxin (ccd killing protein)
MYVLYVDRRSTVPQLHLYVPEETADLVRERARARGTSVSRYLAEVVQRELRHGWPEGWFDDVVGSWTGDAPEIEDRPPESRPPL